MESVISGIIGWIPQYVIEPIRARFRLIRNLGNNIKELTRTADKLDGRRKAQREQVEDAKKQNGVGASADAERWFRQADEVVNEAGNLRTQYDERQSRGSACSNCFCFFFSGYRLSKQAFNLKKHIDDLNVENPIAGWTTASTSQQQKGKQLNTVSLEGQTGRESLKNEIIASVLDDRYLVVGLHGMGGIGKTTLLKHVSNHFTNTKDFDYVIFTTLSATPNFQEMRKEIAQGFRLDLKNCTDDDNVVKQKLSRQTKEKYLLILDDMWESKPPVDLNQICIPAPTKENRCKILMASRSSKVIINKFVNQFARVDSLHAIPVDKLPQHEAWNLFMTKVGESLITSRPKIKPIAEKIVRKCNGLPLIISVVGGTMSTRKTEAGWRDALREMGQLHEANLEDIEEKVFELLKFSFEKLEPLEMSLFLYCCLFPEDKNIWKHQLYPFGIGEKALCDEMPTLGDMRDKVDVLVENLKNSSMLEVADYDDYGGVKMHDVLREFGLWIASPKIIAKEAGKVFTSEWSKPTMVSLYSVGSMLHQLSDDCPHLHTLMLSAEESADMSIPQVHFLEHMPALKILDLDHFGGIKKFPPSVSQIVNLRSLSLRGCDSLKELPPEIGMLVQLISLDLGCCECLRRLPMEMKELKILRYLGIEGTKVLKRIPCGLLSRLHKLEEIRAQGSGLNLDNDNILELYQLLHLTLIDVIRVWKMKVDTHFLKQLAKWSCGISEFRDCDIDSSVLLDFLQFPQGWSYGWLRFHSCKGLTRVPTGDHISKLVVDRCRDLKTLVVVEEEKVDERNNNNNNIIAFQKLELTAICTSNNTNNQYPMDLMKWPSLNSAYVCDCPKLKLGRPPFGAARLIEDGAAILSFQKEREEQRKREDDDNLECLD